ncbi:MAG: hypothetical protein COT74_07555 [Bdellovibrionales bacterium CG10_big_fil_rev_8_21_14_0_10_45_34]|nr:MAG: hypothetical protein COT74_07555 [Bdellovibrionales bacterium CG10_big_fil_rev_8_21_14_0_10_45_34]
MNLTCAGEMNFGPWNDCGQSCKKLKLGHRDGRGAIVIGFLESVDDRQRSSALLMDKPQKGFQIFLNDLVEDRVLSAIALVGLTTRREALPATSTRTS